MPQLKLEKICTAAEIKQIAKKKNISIEKHLKEMKKYFVVLTPSSWYPGKYVPITYGFGCGVWYMKKDVLTSFLTGRGKKGLHYIIREDQFVMNAYEWIRMTTGLTLKDEE